MDARLEALKASLESAVDGLSSEHLRRKVQDKWCAAEVLEHLYLTYTGTIKGLEKALAEGRPLATSASLKQRLATFIVVTYGHMPAGRKTPPVARPRGLGEEEVRAGIAGAIESMDALLSRCEARFGRGAKLLDHPIRGPLSASQWRKFHCVHGRHHHKQLLALRGA
jgi:hypothetical protein